MRRALLHPLCVVLLLAAPALAQDKPGALGGAGKPAPLSPRSGMEAAPGSSPPPAVAPPARTGGERCAAPLREGCERMQASCRMACPPQFSTNPGAPAFTLNDRAGCTAQCLSRYTMCMTQYGCY